MAVSLLTQVMYEVEFEARARVSSGPYTTGNLASKFFRRGPFVTGDTVAGRVGNNASYAQIVHDGARVHEIFPIGAPHVLGASGKRRLKFYWRRVGRIAYFPHIPGSPSTAGRSHPGQKGKHYLSEAILSVADRRGLRVVVYDL
jgi:hypothetical protein